MYISRRRGKGHKTHHKKIGRVSVGFPIKAQKTGRLHLYYRLHLYSPIFAFLFGRCVVFCTFDFLLYLLRSNVCPQAIGSMCPPVLCPFSMWHHTRKKPFLVKNIQPRNLDSYVRNRPVARRGGTVCVVAHPGLGGHLFSMRASVLKTFSVVDSHVPRVSREHPKAVGAEAMGERRMALKNTCQMCGQQKMSRSING